MTTYITDQSTLAFQRLMMDRTRNKPFDPIIKDINGQPVDEAYVKRVARAIDNACRAEELHHIDDLERK
jgi:hypothetical protein